MIARISFILLLLIVLPDWYIDARYLRKRSAVRPWHRILALLPCAGMLVFTAWLASAPNFIPDRVLWLDIYLLLIGILVVPKDIFMVFSVAGLLFRTRHDWGGRIGAVLGVMAAVVTVYGSTLGFRQLEVRRIEIVSGDLPEAFDGYRIVQFSDAHVGTYDGVYRGILHTAVDSINAQNADAVVFTGDLQNIVPCEIDSHAGELGRLAAKDGVFSVLGNHDYSQYVRASDAVKAQYERDTQAKERAMGWILLMNENRKIRRGGDSIVIAGEENDGESPFPGRGDIGKTIHGVGDNAFVVMLQHDPSAWKRSILPGSHAQLTLSGHTHGGQISLFGFRPTMLKYAEDYGLYGHKGRYLNVSCGLGGVIPFRFRMPGEIVVITLRRGDS